MIDLILFGFDWSPYPNISRWRQNMVIKQNGFKQVHEEWFSQVLTTLKIIQIPNGAPSKLPEEEQSRINAINEFCFPPQDWDRHHLPSIDAIDKQVIQSPWEDSFEFQTVDAEIEDAKLMKLQDEIIANFQTDMT